MHTKFKCIIFLKSNGTRQHEIFFILKYENCAYYILFGNISKVLVCFLFLKMFDMLHLFIDNQNVLFFAVEIDLSMLNFSLSIVDSLFLIFKSSDFFMLNYAFTGISGTLINSHNQMYILFLTVIHLIRFILVCLFCFYFHFLINVSKYKFGYEISYMIETYSSY